MEIPNLSQNVEPAAAGIVTTRFSGKRQVASFPGALLRIIDDVNSSRRWLTGTRTVLDELTKIHAKCAT